MEGVGFMKLLRVTSLHTRKKFLSFGVLNLKNIKMDSVWNQAIVNDLKNIYQCGKSFGKSDSLKSHKELRHPDIVTTKKTEKLTNIDKNSVKNCDISDCVIQYRYHLLGWLQLANQRRELLVNHSVNFPVMAFTYR